MLYAGIDIVILIIEIGGMAGISRRTFCTVDCKLLQSAFVRVRFGKHTCHGFKPLIVFRNGFECDLRKIGNPDSRFGALRFLFPFCLKRTADISVEHLIIEVGIGDCREQSVDYQSVGIALRLSHSTQGVIEDGDSACGIKQQVHTGRCLGQFSAYAPPGAACTFGRFLTLVTEHFFIGIHIRSNF